MQTVPIPVELAQLEIICPSCHVNVRATDYFCFNCGHNLKPKPLSTTLIKQLLLYVGAVILPPFGLIWGWPYLKEESFKAKMVCIVTIVLTLASLGGTAYFGVQFANELNKQVNEQMMQLQGF